MRKLLGAVTFPSRTCIERNTSSKIWRFRWRKINQRYLRADWITFPLFPLLRRQVVTNPKFWRQFVTYAVLAATGSEFLEEKMTKYVREHPCRAFWHFISIGATWSPSRTVLEKQAQSQRQKHDTPPLFLERSRSTKRARSLEGTSPVLLPLDQ